MIQKILSFLLPRLVWGYIRLVAFTSEIVWTGAQFHREIASQHSNFIYAFWHGRQVFFTWTHRGENIATLVSKSKDGEYIARVIDLAGMQSVRGSSSRGGIEALRELQGKIENGVSIALTPDGPRGPQRSVKEGVLFLAQKTGKPILPITWSCRRKWVFKGWDDFWVPKPFNHFTVAYASAITVGPQDNLEQKRQELAQALNEITDGVDRIYGQ